METLADYLARLTPTEKKHYERIRRIVHELIPDTEEVISYGIPTFKYRGKYVIYFGAFKDHMSLYPIPLESLREKLKDFKLRKGTIQFSDDKPVPEDIIKEMIEARLAQIMAS